MTHRTSAWLGARSGSHTSKKSRAAYCSLRTPRGGRRTVPMRRPSPRSRGVVVDRTNKHRLVILTQSLSMLPAFALALLVWSRTVAVWHVAALAGFLGVVNAFDIPARQAFIVDLVGKDDLINAIALNSS